jgi:hypothetical protein
MEGAMGFEPSASSRLRRVWETTRDPLLRQELGTILEDPAMSFAPSSELLQQIRNCTECEHQERRVTRDGLCEIHRSKWNLELVSKESRADEGDAALTTIMNSVLADENSSRHLLVALERQLRALHLVWDAHQIGAVRLPEQVAEAVRLARQSPQPRGGTRGVKHAS